MPEEDRAVPDADGARPADPGQPSRLSRLSNADWRLPDSVLGKIWGLSQDRVADRRRLLGKPLAKWDARRAGVRDNPAYRIALGGGADWTVTFPRSGGAFSHVSGHTTNPAVITIDPANPDAATVVEEVPGGEPPSQTVAATVVQASGPRLLTAHVIGREVLNGASPFGLNAAFLFDRVVDATSAATVATFTRVPPPGNSSRRWPKAIITPMIDATIRSAAP